MSQHIHFEQREIKPYAQPVSAVELKVGEVYFFLNYVDHLITPIMETVVFIGRIWRRVTSGSCISRTCALIGKEYPTNRPLREIAKRSFVLPLRARRVIFSHTNKRWTDCCAAG